MQPWQVEGKWYVSYLGWSEKLRAEMPRLPKKVIVRDITFREGDDCIGFSTTTEDKIDLLRFAVKMGIEEIDIGGPSIHKHQYEFGKALKESGIKVRKAGRFFGVTKDFKRDVDLCMEGGSDVIRVVMMARGEESVLNQFEKFPATVDYIHSQYKVEVTWGVADTPRISLDLIRKVYREGLAAGGDRAQIFDTFGVATPPIMRFLANQVREIIPASMGLVCHCHNTFGLGTANSLGAVEGGVNEVDAVINGYGDEAGNASLEEVAVGLEVLYGVDTGLNLEMLKEYSQRAIQKGKLPVQPHKAIVGENAFLRPMSIWAGVDMVKEVWGAREPLNPRLVGTEEATVFGPEGSLDAEPVEWKLKAMGLPHTPMDVVQIQENVKKVLLEEQVSRSKRKYVTEREFEDIVRKTMAKR